MGRSHRHRLRNRFRRTTIRRFETMVRFRPFLSPPTVLCSLSPSLQFKECPTSSLRFVRFLSLSRFLTRFLHFFPAASDVVLDGEQWLAYSCFEEVMVRQKANFRADQAGMAAELSQLQSLIRVVDRGLYRHLGASPLFLLPLSSRRLSRRNELI
jgi:hypothetical protein